MPDTQYKFDGLTFDTAAAMHKSIAEDWISAAGLNDDRHQAHMLGHYPATKLAAYAIGDWRLERTDHYGEPACTGFDRAELVKAFQALKDAQPSPNQ
jgi:hypothetical protein